MKRTFVFFMLKKSLKILLGLALMYIGFWICVSVWPYLLSAIAATGQLYTKSIKAENITADPSLISSVIKNFIILCTFSGVFLALLIKFILGIALIILGIFIVKINLKK